MLRTTIAAVAGLILVSFVLPFSYLPNPVGLVYTMSGGYAYSPRLHFLANGFAILNRGDVEAALRTKLDRLLGATGLDPLDPNQPLQSYEIETVSYGDSDWGIGSVRMTYADGQNHVRIGLGAPPRLSTPAPTTLSSSPPPPPTAAPTAPPATPLPAGPVPQRPGYALLALAWSPVGDRLAAVASDYAEGAMPTLWLLDREGRVLQRVIVGPNGLTRAPQWTPDGRWVFLNTFPESGRRILAIEASSGEVLDLSQPRWDTFFSLSPDGQRLLLWNGRGGFWTVEVLTD